MRGHLDVKDLEKYKKADLQKLARELGVSDEGTVKELAARCAEVEVEVPDEIEEQQAAAQDNPAEQLADAVKVEAIQTYYDTELKRIVNRCEGMTVTEARAAVLVERKVAKIV